MRGSPELLKVGLASDTVVLAIRAAGKGLIEPRLKPALNAYTRFTLVTLADTTPQALTPCER